MNDDALPDAGMQDCKGKELFKQVFFFFFFFFFGLMVCARRSQNLIRCTGSTRGNSLEDGGSVRAPSMAL